MKSSPYYSDTVYLTNHASIQAVYLLTYLKQACMSACRADRAVGNHKARKSPLATQNDEGVCTVHIDHTTVSFCALQTSIP